MASVPQWILFSCTIVAILCLSATYGASLHQKARLVDSREDLSEPLQLRSKSSRKVVKRHAAIHAPILLEEDDEQFQLTVENVDNRKKRHAVHPKRQRRNAQRQSNE